MKPFRAIVFDLDGVIVDSEALHNEAVAAAAAARGAMLPEALFDDFMGIPDEVLLAHVNTTYLQGRYSVAELLADKQAHFLQVADQVRAVPGAVEFIRRARPHFHAFALATSSLRANQLLAFDAFDLHRYFDAVVTADDVTRTKPDPEPYVRAVAQLGLPADDCVVIEDSRNGVRAAKGAGCVVIGLTTTYAAAELTAAGADMVCTSFAEIAALLIGRT